MSPLANEATVGRGIRLVFVCSILFTDGIVDVNSVAACSCVVESPHDSLARADAAFVGRLISRPDEQPGSGFDSDGFEFEVEVAVKGDFPSTIRIRSPLSSAACGLDIAPGQRVGLFLSRAGDHWRSGLCSQIDPDALLAAAAPLSAPDGTGLAVALVGAGEPGVRTLALDAQGRTLAYGAGEGTVIDFAVCPGSRHVVEYSLIHDQERDQRWRLVNLRDLRDFHTVWEIFDSRIPDQVTDIVCRDPDGDDILFLSSGVFPAGAPNARIYRVHADDVEIAAELDDVADCPARGAFHLATGVAYFNGGRGCRTLFRYDLQTGASSEVLSIPDEAGIDAIVALTINPSGTHLVIEAHPGPEPLTFRLLMIDLTANPATFREQVFNDPFNPHTLTWVDDDRLLLTGVDQDAHRARIVDLDLRTIATIDGISGGIGGVSGDSIYVLESYGKITKASPGGGDAEEIRQLIDPSVFAMTTLPDPVTLDLSSVKPDNLAAISFPPPVPEPEDERASRLGRALGAGTLAMLAGCLLALVIRSRGASTT